MIGIWQILIVLIVFFALPIGVFLLGYFIGKKAGFNKAIQEH
jgi:predicted Na+-dependent transporter